MDKEKILQEMTFEEKAALLGGDGKMNTHGVERLGVKAIKTADGPHGTRLNPEDNCTHFPNLCNLGASWDVDTAKLMGKAIAYDCIKHNVDVLLGPGVNIKRHILCGRNFEYLSEDPVLAGELAAGFVEGLQEMGVSACVKHFAVNNHEQFRYHQSVEIDERTMREIYLKAFEIIVKKANPDSIMSAYNKINAVYCSENPHLLNGILRDEWGYDGVVLSDWGACHDISRSIAAGMDLAMSMCPDIEEKLKQGLEDGLVTMEQIDNSVRRMLNLMDRKPKPQIEYDRDEQHLRAREIAAKGMVLLKNDNNLLPITPQKYKKVAVVGEYAASPLIGGQGSAEIAYNPDYTDSPFDEMCKLMPDIEFKYLETYKKGEYSPTMLWQKAGEFKSEIDDCDLVVCFVGAMLSEDTENHDKRTAVMNYNFDMFIRYAQERKKPVAVVIQSGSAMIFGPALKESDAIVEMWISGEAAGGGIADVLCGVVNPSGKLPETFPLEMRTDLEYPGNGLCVEYKERFDVGYRYYDKHPEEILFPFGHGLSYTNFEYSDLALSSKNMTAEFTLKNIGECDGAEVVQLYVSDPVTTVVRPVKELKKFKKVFLKAGEEKRIRFELSHNDLAYFNASLGKWTTEHGIYNIQIGSSSRDIRLKGDIFYSGEMPYSLQATGEAMIGTAD